MDVATVKAKDARDEFMQLLVTQLQHQDPLDPTKQEDFLSQLAQFSSLEQMETMNDQLKTQLVSQQQATQVQYVSQAATLVGKNVDYTVTDTKGAIDKRQGKVESVSFEAGQVKFRVGTDTIKWDQIKTVKDGVVAQQPDSSGLADNLGSSGTSSTTNSDPPLRRTRSSVYVEDPS